jgi:hypothetical protein
MMTAKKKIVNECIHPNVLIFSSVLSFIFSEKRVRTRPRPDTPSNKKDLLGMHPRIKPAPCCARAKEAFTLQFLHPVRVCEHIAGLFRTKKAVS